MSTTSDIETHRLQRAQAWGEAHRILCVRLDNFGDVLMTTPAMRALKSSQPAREITLLTSSAGALVAPHIQEIDAVIEYEAPWVKHPAASSADGCDDLIDALYDRGFAAAVIFTVYGQSALRDAIEAFYSTPLDALVIGSFLLTKNGAASRKQAVKKGAPQRRPYP